jgi:hypothetical protein
VEYRECFLSPFSALCLSQWSTFRLMYLQKWDAPPDSPITCYLRYLQSRQTCCQQPNSLLMTQFHWRRCKTVTGKQFFDT